MKKIVIVVAPDKFHDDEYRITREVLEKSNVLIDVASLDVKKAIGYKKLEVITDLNIRDIEYDKYDGLVIIGGFGVKNYLWESVELHHIIHDFDNHKKLIGAICLAPVCIANTEILKGKKASVYKNKHALEAFKKNEVNYASESVTISENIITANGPKSSRQFGEIIAEKLVE